MHDRSGGSQIPPDRIRVTQKATHVAMWRRQFTRWSTTRRRGPWNAPAGCAHRRAHICTHRCAPVQTHTRRALLARGAREHLPRLGATSSSVMLVAPKGAH
jgi:hypothetical protein